VFTASVKCVFTWGAPHYIEHGIGLSIGVVLFDANTFSNLDALISQADKAMYLQKQSIRREQRVVLST
jgi:GGDEF domain-containing protein